MEVYFQMRGLPMAYRHYTFTCILCVLSLFAPPSSVSIAQTAAPAAKDAIDPTKPLPVVQALLDAGHKARKAKPPRFGDAERLYNEALQTARGVQDKIGESTALRNLGNVGAERGQTATA